MTLRVNRMRLSREQWLAEALAAGIDAHPAQLAADAVILGQPMDVELIPGFLEGKVSVQDQAAQLCASLLRCEPGQRVLDACAAPGGKTGHLLELQRVHLTAVDIQERRLQRVADNLRRLGLSATLLPGDASAPAAWWDANPFDRILLDAPCSATGVIRRHPDIKLLRTPQQVRNASAQQLAMLAGVWNCLADEGLLLYCTCSILPEENESVIGAFLAQTPEARHAALDAEWGLARTFGRQLLPLSGAHDGFYYALLRKSAGS